MIADVDEAAAAGKDLDAYHKTMFACDMEMIRYAKEHGKKAYHRFVALRRFMDDGRDYEALARQGDLPLVLYVSYFTPNYAKPAVRLRRSLDRFHLPHDIQPLKGVKGWYPAEGHKPVFVREMMDKHPEAKAIVWLDADGEMLRFPRLLYQNPLDVAFHWWAFVEPISALVYLRNTERGRKIADRWVEARKMLPKDSKRPSQLGLRDAIIGGNYAWLQLPMAYACLWRYATPRLWAVFRHERWGRNKRRRAK